MRDEPAWHDHAKGAVLLRGSFQRSFRVQAPASDTLAAYPRCLGCRPPLALPCPQSNLTPHQSSRRQSTHIGRASCQRF